MNRDEFQKAWQSQSSQTRVTIAADLLQQQIQRNQQDFLSTILRRDMLEIGVGLAMLPYWVYKGASGTLPWTWWLGVPAILWVVGFFVVDRMRHPQTASKPGTPLVSCARNSLGQVEHQIWLLRNVCWWYLLPFTIALLAFFWHVAWKSAADWLELVAAASFFTLFVAVVYGFIYWLNQRAVQKDLEPRRQELLTLLESLGVSSGEEVSGANAGEMDAAEKSAEEAGKECPPAAWQEIGRVLVMLAVPTAIVCAVAFYFGKGAAGYPKLAPYDAVRWEDSRSEVRIGGEWFELVSIDGVSSTEIVAYCKRFYGEKWRKRFEEDLVEVMAGMGQQPGEFVRLVVVSVGVEDGAKAKTKAEQTLDDVPMTAANRKAIREAAQAREIGK